MEAPADPKVVETKETIVAVEDEDLKEISYNQASMDVANHVVPVVQVID